MIRVGIRELREKASDLVRTVREEGAIIEITYHGKTVALLIPIEKSPSEDYDTGQWERLDHLAARIAANWPEGVSAVEAVAEGRE